MRPSEAVKCAATIQAAYPRPEMSDATIATYERLLVDLDFHEVMSAIDRHTLSSRFMPTVHEIRKECVRVKTSLPPPEIAWGEVRRKVGSHGRNVSEKRPLVFSHPEIMAAVDVVGWQAICNDENVMSTRSRFVDAYRAYYEEAVLASVQGPYAAPPRSLDSPRQRGVPLRLCGPEESRALPSVGRSEWAKHIIRKYEHLVVDDEGAD